MLYDATERFGNSTKASSRKPQPGGLYKGIVVRVAGGIFVDVPKVAPGQTFGPCMVFGPYPILGDNVLCAFLDNKFDELVILGRETTSKVLKDVDTPTANTDASNKLYVDNEVSDLLSYVNAQLATKANI
jgi:hypothetical protein